MTGSYLDTPFTMKHKDNDDVFVKFLPIESGIYYEIYHKKIGIFHDQKMSYSDAFVKVMYL